MTDKEVKEAAKAIAAKLKPVVPEAPAKPQIVLTPSQQEVVASLLKWYKDPKRWPYITVAGYAGTGKTTTIAIWRNEFARENAKAKVAFASYTGKAAQVLQQKLQNLQAVFPGDNVSTIHGLIYNPEVNSRDEIIGWKRKETLPYSMIVIDEASMIHKGLWNDLLQYKVPIIAVGDHGQLPPVGEQSFSLLTNPNLELKDILRQELDNPILALATSIRETGTLEIGRYGDRTRVMDLANPESQELMWDLLGNFNDDTLLLCGFNHTRVKLNNQIRGIREYYSPQPERGERVICLRNNHAKGIYNGMLGKIESIENAEEPNMSDWYRAGINFADYNTDYHGLIYKPQFGALAAQNFSEDRNKTMAGDLFDFGYALTVHKAQGSEAERVIVIAERSQHMDDDTWKRWLYTGVTRAQRELYVFKR